MKAKQKKLTELIRSGSERGIAQAISVIERGGEKATELLAEIYPQTGRAKVLGITGSPGAGKSTLVDHLAAVLARKGSKVAVLAIDPTSPFSGGAILGDRIRMTSAVAAPQVFVRSMATRGALGGVAQATGSAVMVLDAAGFEFIIIETVGVGQSEVDIAKLGDLCAVVLVPGMGDSIQTLKAGILEIADLFVINKADYEGADRLERELRAMLALRANTDTEIPIARTVATTGEGVAELVDTIDAHFAARTADGSVAERRRQFLDTLFRKHLEHSLLSIVLQELDPAVVAEARKAVFERRESPWSGAERIISRYVKRHRDS